uniref:Uncharacterized protein MANES_04G055000 n=1 Tax=Rhizophora mucronata TaxID=61149 RepID=A0A2P2JDQ7_RHIMU
MTKSSLSSLSSSLCILFEGGGFMDLPLSFLIFLFVGSSSTSSSSFGFCFAAAKYLLVFRLSEQSWPLCTGISGLDSSV